jgi:hypothetical protein
LFFWVYHGKSGTDPEAAALTQSSHFGSRGDHDSMSVERIDVYTSPEFPVSARASFTIGDEVRVPEVPHWPPGKVVSIDDGGRPHIRWENGFVDVFNWLHLEKVR